MGTETKTLADELRATHAEVNGETNRYRAFPHPSQPCGDVLLRAAAALEAKDEALRFVAIETPNDGHWKCGWKLCGQRDNYHVPGCWIGQAKDKARAALALGGTS